MKNISVYLTFLIWLFLTSDFISQNFFHKALDDDNSKYTNVGNIGITITNFGTYGHGFALWPKQPSCEFPIGSGIEHIFDGGLWIGGYLSNDLLGSGRTGPYVTTGAVDAASVAQRGGGFEFTNDRNSRVIERSSLFDSRFYSPNAISHQDFIAIYTDTNTTYLSGEVIENHSPFGVVVRQETYAWNYDFANNFVIFNYWIKNVSKKYQDSVYVGLWTDAVVRNTNITSPRTGSSFYNKGGNGFDDSLNIAYEFDAAGDLGFSDSYIGVQYLGSSQIFSKANFVSWQFRNTDDLVFFAPRNDNERYMKLKGFFAEGIRFNQGVTPAQLKTPSNRSILISVGPFNTIAPGDSINVVFAILCAKKYGNEPASLDSREQKRNLFLTAGWAKSAYQGEDRNGNNILDPDEDLDGDGKITRYILPAPPRAPKTRIEIYNNKAILYWDKTAESSVDPISGKKDFEGYRIYKTKSGFDLSYSQDLSRDLLKVAEFDSAFNSIGFNTGFGAIRLSEPKIFPGDSTKYYYRYEFDNLLMGWQYAFSVTAFDKGDEERNLESLESSKLANVVKVVIGSQPNDDDSEQIGVFPNPYYGEAYWDGRGERLRKIYFFNLPSECEIYIYTLAGDVVKKIRHSASQYNASDIEWFRTFSKDGKQIFPGGMRAWDLVTDNDQAIATGLYIYSVKNLKNGKIKTGKFLILK